MPEWQFSYIEQRLLLLTRRLYAGYMLGSALDGNYYYLVKVNKVSTDTRVSGQLRDSGD